MKCFFFLLAIAFVAAKTSYEGYKVFQIVPQNIREVQILKNWMNTDDRLDFWTEPAAIGKSVSICVQRSLIRSLEIKLRISKLSFKIVIDDLEKLIDEQSKSVNDDSKVVFDKYNRYDSIQTFMMDTASSCINCEIFSIGKTSEGRTMRVIKIGTSGQNRQAQFLECGIHAREWISPSVCINLIRRLALDYNSDARVKSMVDKYDWYIIPVSNPDGYEYTFTNTRLWRKTRSVSPGSNCRGVDPNRNWGYKFGGVGTSSNPCSDIFRGRNAFSEPETANIRDFVLARKNVIQSYNSIHSYGQYFLLPWGYAREFPQDFADIEAAATAGNNALYQKHFTDYTVGNSAVLLGATAGSSDDWAKGDAGIKFTYTIELRDTGRFGFVLPAVQIIPTYEEIFEAFHAMHLHYFNNFPN